MRAPKVSFPKRPVLFGVALGTSFIVGILLGALPITVYDFKSEHWPEHQLTAEQRTLGEAEAAKYREKKYKPYVSSKPYVPDGAYFAKTTKSYRNTERLKLDSAGLPMVKYGGQFQYNPVTLSQFALGAYNDHLKGGAIKPLVSAVEKLLEMQRDDGALPYNFVYRHYTVTLPYAKGWFSGMAQGQALSALGRGYNLTGNKEYLDAGNKALAFLQVGHPNGPMTDLTALDPSLSGYIFFQEYPVEPHVYTLNGYMFTLLGLYDWSQLARSEEAGKLFTRGMKTLVKILPYYDVGTFSAYDLSYITHTAAPYQVPRKPHLAATYHRVHIELLLVLASITGEQVLKETAHKWQAYVPR